MTGVDKLSREISAMLRDHFHPPLREQRHWHGFHNAWATVITEHVSQQLPPGWFAEPNVQFGIEIDVAAFEEAETTASEQLVGHTDSSWTPGKPTMTVEYPIVTDIVQVDVYSTDGGPILVGAIELVSPSNKDRPEHRDAFVSKCDALLREGIGLVVVDIVTGRHADLHAALLKRAAPDLDLGKESKLYAAAYRPTVRNSLTSLDIWHQELDLGQQLSTMPLYLRGGPMIAVNLQSTYEATCRILRIAD